MLRIHFTAEDLARTRIAARPDPLWEILLSLNLLQSTEGELWYGAWRRRVRQTLSPHVARLLCELTPPVGYSPDFLTPAEPPEEIDEAIDQLLHSPRRQVREDLRYLGTRQASSPWTRALAAGESRTMGMLGRAFQCYHRTAIAPYWRSARRDLMAEHTARMHQFSDHGVARVLATLSARTRWQSPVLEIPDFVDEDLHLDGRGLLLQPSFFCWQVPTKFRSADLPPVLVYPVRHGPPAGSEAPTHSALAALLGSTRAKVLEATISAVSTKALAELLDMTSGNATHHTGVLREAGLITSHRAGGSMMHEITALGLGLLEMER